MSQLQLFRSDHAEPARRPPDLGYIRKCLARSLRLVRDAEIMPWSEGEAEIQERHFPQLAALLPPEEAEALTSEFRSELTRLRAVG